MNSTVAVVAAVFALSLLGAVVLFHFFKSSALIKQKTYQAGGAVAGFIVIYGLLFASYHQIERLAKDKMRADLATIQATLTTLETTNASLKKQLESFVVVSGVVAPDRQPLKVRLVVAAVEPDSGGRFSFRVPAVLLDSPSAAVYAVTDDQHAILEETCARQPCHVPESSIYLWGTQANEIKIPVRLQRR